MHSKKKTLITEADDAKTGHHPTLDVADGSFQADLIIEIIQVTGGVTLKELDRISTTKTEESELCKQRLHKGIVTVRTVLGYLTRDDSSRDGSTRYTLPRLKGSL